MRICKSLSRNAQKPEKESLGPRAPSFTLKCASIDYELVPDGIEHLFTRQFRSAKLNAVRQVEA